MQEFVLNGVTIALPDAVITPQLQRAFETGSYESSESAALLKHLRPRDRFLDLGAGAGYLAALAGCISGVNSVAGVEASPKMAQIARQTLARNNVTGQILSGAVVPDTYLRDTVTLTLRRSFWASSLTPPDGPGHSTLIEVPALRFGGLMATLDPTVICVDIEGGELDLFETLLPDPLRLIVLELHPSAYGKAGIKRIFDALLRQGFVYCPKGSKGGTVVFERVD